MIQSPSNRVRLSRNLLLKAVPALIAVFLFAGSPYVRAQTPEALQAQPAFEVASIRMVEDHTADLLAKGIQPMSWSTFPTNRFFAHNVTFNILLAFAYGIDERYIQNSPAWFNSQLYDVEGRVEGDKQLTFEQFKPLIQNLLQQRFHLVSHRHSKLFPGYALVVAKSGAKLQVSKHNIPPHVGIRSNRLEAWDITTEDFAGVLSRPVGYPVVNKTGITGTYDIDLSFAAANDSNPGLPDLFTALQEQLGVKLQSQKVPVDIVVIDHVERVPTEN